MSLRNRHTRKNRHTRNENHDLRMKNRGVRYKLLFENEKGADGADVERLYPATPRVVFLPPLESTVGNRR